MTRIKSGIPMFLPRAVIAVWLSALLAGLAVPNALSAEPAHGLAMQGKPLFPAGFTSFSYVNPDAPKGGTVRFGAIGSFDTLNPLNIKGVSAAGIRDFVYESLMTRCFDEPFTLYGVLAQSIETPDDRSWVEFTLNEKARFSDGKPVTVEDVIFSHALLRDKGQPNHRSYYSEVAKVEQTGPRSVRFTFKTNQNRELPLILGLMPVLPKHAVNPETFEQTTFVPPIGSGPYEIAEVDPGSRIIYKRREDYWGWDVPANRGRYNFDTIQFDYIRDSNALFEAFKKGLVDIRQEGDPSRWNTAYDFPAVTDGRVVRETFQTKTPSGMSALVFNTRKPVFADIRVRKALITLFDAEWINKNLYFGSYKRTQSYFDNSELGFVGKPADAREREILGKYADTMPAEMLDGSYRQPATDGSGRSRANRRTALTLLEEAGYRLSDGKMIGSDGKPLGFEILVANKEQERLALAYARAVARVGIDVHVRPVDSSEYQRRIQAFDFDMMQWFWYASLSPGNEQNFYWSEAAADRAGSRNYMGMREKAADAMIDALLAARNREDFVAAARNLDRSIMAGAYFIPLFYQPTQWVARWRNIAHPENTSLDGYKTDTWWYSGN